MTTSAAVPQQTRRAETPEVNAAPAPPLVVLTPDGVLHRADDV